MAIETSLKEVLEEVLEHTKDSDASRSQHFCENVVYTDKAKRLDFFQMISLITLVVYYVVYAELGKFFNLPVLLSYIPPALSIIAMIIDLWVRFTDYAGLSQRHWEAAQAYTRIYRECQFFCVHYANIEDIQTLRSVAHDLANEISNINMLAPGLRADTWEKVKPNLETKRYPIQDILDMLE